MYGQHFKKRSETHSSACDAHHGQPAVVQLLVLRLPELVPDALLILSRIYTGDPWRPRLAQVWLVSTLS